MATQAVVGNGKTGITIIDSLRQIDPDKNIALIAVGKLSTRVDIVRFYDSYIQYLQKYGDVSEKQNPYDSATKNLLFATGYCDEKTRSKWHSVLKEIENSEYTKILRK